MNHQDIKNLYAYNRWAMKRVFDAVSKLTPEQFAQDLKSSHGGVHGTLVHCIGAEKVWLSRWRENPDKVFLQPQDAPTLNDLRSLWDKVDTDREAFIDTLDDTKLNTVRPYPAMSGKMFNFSYAQMMQHVVNHSTYHRGQVITMLRQLGAAAVSTDMIAYTREITGQA